MANYSYEPLIQLKKFFWFFNYKLLYYCNINFCLELYHLYLLFTDKLSEKLQVSALTMIHFLYGSELNNWKLKIHYKFAEIQKTRLQKNDDPTADFLSMYCLLQRVLNFLLKVHLPQMLSELLLYATVFRFFFGIRYGILLSVKYNWKIVQLNLISSM